MIRYRLAGWWLALIALPLAGLVAAQEETAPPPAPVVPDTTVDIPPPPVEPQNQSDTTEQSPETEPAPPEIPPPPQLPQGAATIPTPLLPETVLPPSVPERIREKTKPKKKGPPPVYDPEAVHFTVRYNEENLDFLVKLRPDLAPKTVENFKRNVESGFYKGIAFHRVVQNYLMQAGDPLTRDDAQKDAWGTSDIGQSIPGEFKGEHDRFVIGMAHKPGELSSSGSQFYITLRSAPNLDGAYAVFGEITEGRDVLNRLSGVVVDSNDTPLRRIEIVDAKLVPATTTLKPSAQVLGGRRMTKPASQKSRFTRFIERIW